MSTIVPGQPQTIQLIEGRVLNITGAANTVGALYLLDPVAGGTNSSQSWTVGVGALTQIGPFSGVQKLLVTCSVGSIDAQVHDASVTAPQIVTGAGGSLSLQTPAGLPISTGGSSSLAIDQFAGLPLIVYGCSYDAVDTNNTPGTRTVVQFAAKNRMTLTNNAVAGTMMMDFAGKAIGAAPYPVGTNGVGWIGNSINDAARVNPNPSDARQQAGYQQALATIIYRMSASAVVPETAANFVFSGTWTVSGSPSSGSGAWKSTTTVGDSVTITTPAGKNFVLLMLAVYNTTQGSASITVDGTPIALVVNPQCGTSPGGSSTTCPYPVVITGLANTAHTIVVTKTDATTNKIFIDDLFVLSDNPPLIIAEKSVLLQPAGYTFEGGQGSDATVNLYNGLFDSVVAGVKTAYPAARIVVSDPQAAGFVAATMLGAADGLHPNDYGEYFRRITADKAAQTYMSSAGWLSGINKI